MTILDTLFFAGRPLSPIYSSLMQLRSWLYRRNIKKSFCLPVPVISVGNLTLGGSGKTPVVIMIARLLLEKGMRPAIVSRGYGGRASQKINIVSTGSEILLDAIYAGDEPYLIAKTVPGAVVITGKKRILPCDYAVNTMQCDCIILDDGFQHLSVERDVNLVLFNATTLAGNSRVFPGGELREPVSALQRADAFLLTGVSEHNSTRAAAFSHLLTKRFTNIPVFTSGIRVAGVFHYNGEHARPDEIQKPLFAFSGIAHPERFHLALEQHKISVAGTARLKDHASYNEKDIKLLTQKALQNGAAGLITTEKDMVKLPDVSKTFPIFYLAIENSPSEPLTTFLETKIESCLSKQKLTITR